MKMQALAMCRVLDEAYRGSMRIPIELLSKKTLTALCLRLFINETTDELTEDDVDHVDVIKGSVFADVQMGIVRNMTDAMQMHCIQKSHGRRSAAVKPLIPSLINAQWEYGLDFGLSTDACDIKKFPLFVQRFFNKTCVNNVVFVEDEKNQSDHRGLFATVPITEGEIVAEMAMPRKITLKQAKKLRMTLHMQHDDSFDFLIQRGAQRYFDDTWLLLKRVDCSPALRLLLCGKYVGYRKASYLKPRWYLMNNALTDENANVKVHFSTNPLLCVFKASKNIQAGQELRWNYNQRKRVTHSRPQGRAKTG